MIYHNPYEIAEYLLSQGATITDQDLRYAMAKSVICFSNNKAELYRKRTKKENKPKKNV